MPLIGIEEYEGNHFVNSNRLPDEAARMVAAILEAPLDRGRREALADWFDETGRDGGDKLRTTGRLELAHMLVWFGSDASKFHPDRYVCLGWRDPEFDPVCARCNYAVGSRGCHSYGQWLHWDCGAKIATKTKQSDWEWREANES